jgi:protein-S-isoprenylcysteine O-methyltransferase Ste14
MSDETNEDRSEAVPAEAPVQEASGSEPASEVGGGGDTSAEPPRKKKKKKRSDEPAEPLEHSAAVSALSKHSWKAGVAGMFTMLTLGYLAMQRNVLENGWGILPNNTDKNLSLIFPLVITAAVMLAVEVGVRIQVEGPNLISRRVDKKDFFRECFLVYATELGILAFAWLVYHKTGEYGAMRKAGPDYYKPWFSILEIILKIYAFGGLPYVLITRSLQHDPKADKKQLAFTVMKAIRWLASRVSKSVDPPAEPFGDGDSTALYGFFVKFFFVPLMTVFFVDQFTSLVKNYDFVVHKVLPMEHWQISTRDVYNVLLSLIFTVDVGLAWGGYVLSTRWIRNTMWSVEPTLAGWTVALLCYPPFNRVPGFYFQNPGDHTFLNMTDVPRLVNIFAAMSITSFTVYTAATVVFGLRFSNLTHRGIITTGPYAYIRHPAYASKNFSWWCVMLPVALMQAKTEGWPVTLLNIVGLVTLTGQYWLRALTEERHLKKDPEYLAYMKKVPYRFIPGVF